MTRQLLQFIKNFWIILFISLIGCKVEIVHNLTESEANKILSELNYKGIRASKEPEGDSKWQILVEEEDNFSAIAIINQTGFGLKKTVKKLSKSIIQTESEANDYRLELLAQSLEESLGTLSGVLVASVHLNMPLSSNLHSASVLLIVKEPQSINQKIIQDLIIGATGLKRQEINILINQYSTEYPGIQKPNSLNSENLHKNMRISFLISLTGVFIFILNKIFKFKGVHYGN